MIEIVVYGSNSLVLAGLVSTLNRQENLRVVNSSFSQTDLMSAMEFQPDLLLLEQSADEDWWVDPARLPADLELPIILLQDSLSDGEMSEYLSLGFKAFLPRLIAVDELIATINAVMLGLIVIHPDLALFAENSAITPATTSEIPLTSREKEVLQLLANGLDNKAIALQLQISKHTVKFHISSILSKLDVSSRTEAVTFGLRQGLILL
ncbi:response regulator transcription factor [Pleurocapsales cyanobacterium LEGE 10410]|nr:response regulator transcription factor [Pleurocapsales cyanobacterium LEGE 10410]